MSSRFWISWLAIAFISLMVVALMSRKDMHDCDQVIFLEGEMGMDCSNVTSFENGMSIITLCDDTKMRVPTSRIVKIVDKE